MRTTLCFAAAGLLLNAYAAAGQAPITVPITSGSTEIGAQVSNIDGDVARSQRYRDLSDGMLFDRVRIDRNGDNWLFSATGDHVGRQDQRLGASFQRGNKLKMTFLWDQIPLYMSASDRTPYAVASPGVLRLDPSINESIQAGRMTTADLAATSTATELRSHRYIADFDLLYSPTRFMDVKLKVSQTQRQGTTPFMASFAFSDAVEVSAPIDTTTTDVDGGIEWSSARGMVRVGYLGSWFDNKVPTLVWDNPLKVDDATSATAYQNGLGGSQGQLAMPPSNDRQGMTTAASLSLPAHTRVTGSVTASLFRQDAGLLPATINAAVPAIALSRQTADAEARTLAMNYTVTSRPANALWLNARYRYYTLNNRTPVFLPERFVVMDQTAHEGVPTHPISYTRQNLDVDASLTPLTFAAIRVGFTRAGDDRPTRIYEKTTEDVYRSSLDTGAVGIFTFRALYERSKRRGSHLDEEWLIEAGEQPDMRHYDIADRDRDRVTALVQASPHKTVSLSASIATGRDRYPDSGFGLQDADTKTYTVGAELAAGKHVGATAQYARERYSALQWSRTASPNTPQVTDPTRDWGYDSSDRVETIGASFDVLKLIPRTDVRLTYDRTTGRSSYAFRVPATSTLAPLAPLPPVRSELAFATGDVQFSLTRHVALGGGYWYDRYSVDDFATNDAILQNLALPGALYMGSLFRPSTAKTGSLRLIFIW